MNDLKDLLILRVQDINLLTGNQQIHLQQGTQNNFEQNKPQSNSNIANPNLEKIWFEFSPHQTHLVTQRINQDDFNENKKIINKLNFLIKKKQKVRVNAQNKLLLALNNSTFLNHKQIQDFYLLSLQIFESYDPEFSKYKNQSSFMSVSMQQNLKKLYSFFFLKHDEQQSGKSFTLEVSRLDIMDLSPSFFLGWIKKWSTTLLQSLLNLNEDNNEFKIGVKLDTRKIKQKILNKNLTFDIFAKKHRSNSFNFLTENKSAVESPHKKMKEIKQNKIQKTFEGKINKLLSSLQLNQSYIYVPVNSKQMVYSYCLEELKTYYKNYPIEDLDQGYLKGFKKVGKKDEILLGSNSKNSLQTLIDTKNAAIKASINKFQNQYNKFKILQNLINSKKQKILKNNSIKSQNHFKFNQKEINNEKGTLNFNQKGLSSLGSKLLSPINKAHHQKRKNLKLQINQKNGFIPAENQIMKIQQDSFQNKCSNSMQFKREIINYNQIFSQKKNEQFQKNQAKIELLKRFNQRFGNNQKVNGNNECQRQFQKQKNNLFQEIDRSNDNFPKLPRLSIKAKSKQFNKKIILIPQTDQRFNKSELITQKKKPYFLDKLNTEEVNEILHLQNLQLQKIHQKPSEQFVSKRFISQVSQKEIQRSMSHFSSNCKLFIGSKKPSLNMVRFPKNKTLTNDQTSNFQALTAFKNKLKDKNSSKFKNKNEKTFSQNSGNVFSSQKIGSDSQSKKDQFIEYLKNLHRQKIKSQVFQNRQSKQKQKHIKRRGP